MSKVFNLHWYVQPKTRSTGFVSGPGKLKIPIYVKDQELAALNNRYIMSSTKEIAISTLFLGLDEEFKEACIWHEVGHIFKGHFSSGLYTNSKQYSDDRKEHITSGVVHPFEAEADDFAVKIVGVGAMVKALQILIQSRLEDPNLLLASDTNRMGIRELELRQDRLNNIYNER